jgi:hypothetical protein
VAGVPKNINKVQKFAWNNIVGVIDGYFGKLQSQEKC